MNKMDETTEKCPISLEDFNTDDPDKIPYRLCDKSHFSCKGCIKPFIESNFTDRDNFSITTNASDSTIKLVCQYDEIGENSLTPCIKCPTCRNPIKYDFKKLRRNNQSWKVVITITFHRDRYFEEKINNPPIDKTLRERADMKKIEELRLMNKKKEETNIQNKKTIKFLEKQIELLKDSNAKYDVVITNPPYGSSISYKEIIQCIGRPIGN
jgi:hypothetical protein